MGSAIFDKSRFAVALSKVIQGVCQLYFTLISVNMILESSVNLSDCFTCVKMVLHSVGLCVAN